MGNIFADRISDVPRSFIREILKLAVDESVISFAGGLKMVDMVHLFLSIFFTAFLFVHVYLATLGPQLPVVTLTDVSTGVQADQLTLPASCTLTSYWVNIQAASFGRGGASTSA